MTYPKRVEDITPDWLNRTLMKSGVIDGESIVDFNTRPVSKQGMTSTVHVLSLIYDGSLQPASVPRQLVFKTSLDHPIVKEALGNNLGFQREASFYIDFGDTPGIPVPRCYAAEYDSEEISCMLLMDYIGNTCHRDVLSGNPEDIELAVRHLAAFHATWWNKKDALSRAHPHHVSLLLPTFIEKLSRSLENMRRFHREKVGNTLISLLELWLPNARLLDDCFNKGPVTLIHGDFYRTQLLFPKEEGDSAGTRSPAGGNVAFCVIDWQLCAAAPGPTDLAQIVVTGLLPEQRRKKEAEFLNLYYHMLLSHGVSDYSFEQMHAQYKLGLVQMMLFYLCAFEAEDITPVLEYWNANGLKGKSFWEVNCDWPAMALEDNEVLPFLTGLIADPLQQP